MSSWCCPRSFCHGKDFLELLDDHLIAPPPSHLFILLQPHCRLYKCWTTTVTYIQPSVTLPANRGWCFWDDPSKNRRSIWIQSSYTPIVFFILFLSHSYCTSSVNQDTLCTATLREIRITVTALIFYSLCNRESTSCMGELTEYENHCCAFVFHFHLNGNISNNNTEIFRGWFLLASVATLATFGLCSCCSDAECTQS